jgi:octaprenyl-diphosphate synthase
LQLTLIGRTDVTEEQYFDVLRRKTAYLFSACCEIGAILGGATPEEREGLRDYGLNLGTAFQLVDDLLDFTSTDGVLGKPAGVDLLEGKVTLPLIHLIEAEPQMRQAAQQVMREGGYREHPRQTFLRAAEKSGALARARARANAYADAAARALGALKPSPHADALRSIPAYILERET